MGDEKLSLEHKLKEIKLRANYILLYKLYVNGIIVTIFGITDMHLNKECVITISKQDGLFYYI